MRLFRCLLHAQAKMSSAESKLVFVYGTLKTGEPNHPLMSSALEGCKALGVYRTVEKFPLVVASRYNVPYLLYAQGQGNNVQGELYEVNDAQLERMDDLEAHPRYYERKDLVVTPAADSDQSANVTAEAYFMVKFRPELLKLPMYASYTDCIDGKKYIGPKERKDNTSYWHEIHTGYEKESDQS